MKKAVAYLEQFLDKQAGGDPRARWFWPPFTAMCMRSAKIWWAPFWPTTVTRSSIWGFRCPANVIIDQAVQAGADAIGLSALLVSTSKQMPLIVRELDQRGLNLPVLIGGAAINRRFGQRLMFLDDHFYEPGVVYCQDAFTGLEALDTLADPEQKTGFLRQLRDDAAREIGGASPAPRPRRQSFTSAWQPAAHPRAALLGAPHLVAHPPGRSLPVS